MATSTPPQPEPPRTPLEQWLRYAPGPTPIESPLQYHVFLSYRSVRREWVLQLHDILRHLDYKVFLDQLVIPGGGTLPEALAEGLRQSASAILIWSAEYNESPWCRQEYNTLERRRVDGKASYVVAKLDKSPLPEFAENTTYIDFSESCEGPTGSGLLKLLYGLRGQPLPDAAVHLAAEVDSETNNSVIKIKAARDVGNRDRLLELAKADSLAWSSSPVLTCEVAEALIAISQNEDALAVLQPLLTTFPKAARPKQLRGLAHARQKRWQEAQTIFSELYQAGEIDSETLGMYARTWRDRYAVSHNEQHLQKARDLYLQAFKATPKDFYTGINAAANSVLLGDLDLAASLAGQVEKLVGSSPKPGDYWKNATMAEVQLLKQDYKKAATLYREAVADAPEQVGSHKSTFDQVQRLLGHLKPTDEERQEIEKVFCHLKP